MPTANFNYSTHSISSTDSPIFLLELSYSILSNPLRLVNDNIDIISNGNNYSRASFNFDEPPSGEKQNPKASISIACQLELARLIQQANGMEGATISIKQIMRNTPDIIEISYINLIIISNFFKNFLY